MRIIEYYLNLLYYSAYRFEFITSKIIEFCIVIPFVSLFKFLFPKKCWPIGMKNEELRNDCNKNTNVFFAINTCFWILLLNILSVLGWICYGIDKLCNHGLCIMFILGIVIAISLIFVQDHFIMDRNQYITYVKTFEQKPKKWKVAMTIIGFFLAFESLLIGPFTLYFLFAL